MMKEVTWGLLAKMYEDLGKHDKAFLYLTGVIPYAKKY